MSIIAVLRKKPSSRSGSVKERQRPAPGSSVWVRPAMKVAVRLKNLNKHYEVG